MQHDEATLLDVENAARLVLAFIQDMSKGNFFDDTKTQSAVLHQLLIIGEAVKRLSSEFRRKQPTIPWMLIAGMRDNLIHEYNLIYSLATNKHEDTLIFLFNLKEQLCVLKLIRFYANSFL